MTYEELKQRGQFRTDQPGMTTINTTGVAPGAAAQSYQSPSRAPAYEQFAPASEFGMQTIRTPSPQSAIQNALLPKEFLDGMNQFLRNSAASQKPSPTSSRSDQIMAIMEKAMAPAQRTAAPSLPYAPRPTMSPGGSLGGQYYNGVLRPSNWVAPTAEELKDPNWEQARDMEVRKKNSERYAMEQSFSSPEEQARYGRILAARQQYDRTEGLARSLGFTPEYLTDQQISDMEDEENYMPISMRDRGLYEADLEEYGAKRLAETVRGLIEAKPGDPRFADRLALRVPSERTNGAYPNNMRPMTTEEFAQHYEDTMNKVKERRAKAGRIRSAAEAIPQSLFMLRP